MQKRINDIRELLIEFGLAIPYIIVEEISESTKKRIDESQIMSNARNSNEINRESNRYKDDEFIDVEVVE